MRQFTYTKRLHISLLCELFFVSNIHYFPILCNFAFLRFCTFLCVFCVSFLLTTVIKFSRAHTHAVDKENKTTQTSSSIVLKKKHQTYQKSIYLVCFSLPDRYTFFSSLLLALLLYFHSAYLLLIYSILLLYSPLSPGINFLGL
jgi:hypothetical protein